MATASQPVLERGNTILKTCAASQTSGAAAVTGGGDEGTSVPTPLSFNIIRMTCNRRRVTSFSRPDNSNPANVGLFNPVRILVPLLL